MSNIITDLIPAAQASEQQSGIPASVTLGQAILESDWGTKTPKDYMTGQESYNLFGIKAGSSWTGPTVESYTTEYVNGQAKKVLAKFRAYSSYAASLTDHTKLLMSPTYQNEIKKLNPKNPSEYALALQKAGYATDPKYANKLAQTIFNNGLYVYDKNPNSYQSWADKIANGISDSLRWVLSGGQYHPQSTQQTQKDNTSAIGQTPTGMKDKGPIWQQAIDYVWNKIFKPVGNWMGGPVISFALIVLGAFLLWAFLKSTVLQNTMVLEKEG